MMYVLQIYSGNEVKDKNGQIVSNVEGELSKNSIDSDIIEFTNLPTGNYLVTAKAISPYAKTLQATFSLTQKNEDIEYSISDSIGNPILQLTVRTFNYKGNVKITWPSNIAPDNTNMMFTDINTGYNAGNKEITFETDSEYVFQFFKLNPNAVFSKNDFSVERSN